MMKRISLHVTIPENLVEYVDSIIKPGQRRSNIVEEIVRFHQENYTTEKELEKELEEVKKDILEIKAMIRGLLVDS